MKQRKKLTKTLLIVSIGVFFGAVNSGTSIKIGMDKAKATQQSMVAVSSVIDMYADEYLQYPAAVDEFIPLSQVLRLFDPKPKHLAMRDAWGKPIMYWSNNDGYMLVSFGSDRQAEFSYEAYELPYEPVTRGRATINPEQDIIVVCGRVWQGPVLGDRSRSRMTMADMRSIGTAVETYSIDNNVYPGFSSNLIEVSALEEHLSPGYIRNLPEKDGWNNPFLYWSDQHSYTVISVGADALADAPYDEWTVEDFMSYEGSAVIEPRFDLRFTDGSFRQWHARGGSFRSMLTVDHLRRIATAVETYSIDNNIYPGSSSMLVEVSELEEYLSPIYIRGLPLKDGWGNPFLYWSDQYNYTIISVGADALADAPYDEWTGENFILYEGGEVSETHLDLLFTNGQLVQWHANIGDGSCP